MRAAHVAPIRARCFNSKRTSFHVALELEHVESVNLRSAIRKADAVLPVFARAGQRSDTLKRVARRGRCRLLFRVGVQDIPTRHSLDRGVPRPRLERDLGDDGVAARPAPTASGATTWLGREAARAIHSPRVHKRAALAATSLDPSRSSAVARVDHRSWCAGRRMRTHCAHPLARRQADAGGASARSQRAHIAHLCTWTGRGA